MTKFNGHQVKEINEVIESISKAIDSIKTKKIKIGARDKATLLALLKANNIEFKGLKFFKCKRDYSDTLVSHFVTKKNLPKDRFTGNNQEHIYILY